MIVTLAQAKALLQITSATYDAVIQSLIPIVEDDVIRYCNTAWEDKYIYRASAGNIAMVKGDPDTITDSDSLFVKSGFTADMDIFVSGGNGTNEGVFGLATVVAGTLTLDSVNQLVDQDPTDSDANTLLSFRISRINWPRGIGLPASQMIWYHVKQGKPTDVVSERIDDYAVTYIGGGNQGGGQMQYPARILDGLNKFRIAKLS